MNVEVLYFEGCSNYLSTIEMIRQHSALSEY